MMTARQLFERYSPEMDDAPSLLKQIIDEAHTVIKLIAVSAEQEPHSTLAAFLINAGGDCHWIHTGDSRIYHYHGNALLHRTKDHSYVQTLVDKGELTASEANVHPQSNILMGCLGTEEPPPFARHLISKLQIGDVLMACTDGLWHYFDVNEMGSALSMLSPREATEFLIQKARARAQRTGDNLSLVIVKWEAIG
jgi:serine/threonine protein phosphatase PrpC